MIALAALILVALVALLAFAALRWQARGFERERQVLMRENARLVNQLLHLVDRTWEPPPAFAPEPSLEDELDNLVPDPAQLPEE